MGYTVLVRDDGFHWHSRSDRHPFSRIRERRGGTAPSDSSCPAAPGRSHCPDHEEHDSGDD